MNFYILLTHGAKPKGSISNHPAARAQIANLKALRERSGDQQKPRVIFDYNRKIRGLGSLPQLARFLSTAREQGSGVIVMDNIARLFAACDADFRHELLDELLINKDHFFGLRQGGTLSGMTHTQLVLMASGRETTRFIYGGRHPRSSMSKAARKEQTADATIASKIARGQAADEKARELDTIREELTLNQMIPTLKMITDEANNRGVTTTRDGVWTPSTVGRTLKRLERPTLAEKARRKSKDGNSSEAG